MCILKYPYQMKTFPHKSHEFQHNLTQKNVLQANEWLGLLFVSWFFIQMTFAYI